jgi:serine/threonine protein phosphatase PrpC
MNLLEQIASFGSTQMMTITSRSRASQRKRDVPVAVVGDSNCYFLTEGRLITLQNGPASGADL